jgi:predicted oxidoreductase (fatty acid repression mutant protein)
MEKEEIMTITQKMEKLTLDLNNARVAECEAINKSAKAYVSKNIAECKKVASELKKSDAAYAKAAAAFTKKPTASNQYELSVAKADLEACVAGYNTLVNNISASLVEIKNNYALINDYVHVVDAAKAAKHADDYANYGASIEKTMNAIAKSLRNCKSVEK